MLPNQQCQSTEGIASCTHTRTHAHTQLFNGLWSGTTQVGRYHKKHSPTHTHPDNRTSFINFLHLLRSTAPPCSVYVQDCSLWQPLSRYTLNGDENGMELKALKKTNKQDTNNLGWTLLLSNCLLSGTRPSQSPDPPYGTVWRKMWPLLRRPYVSVWKHLCSGLVPWHCH